VLGCGGLPERYEQLRSQARTQGHRSRGSELSLFVYRGMAAWMEAWGDYPPAGERGSTAASAQGRSGIQARSDMVMLLVGMALACAKEKQGDG
jgi:hypothetical protein